MSSSVILSCLWMVLLSYTHCVNGSNDQTGDTIVDETDILNLHTYDFYDWFLLMFCMIIFGIICLCIGCIGQNKWIKYRQSQYMLAEMEDNMNRNKSQNKQQDIDPEDSYSTPKFVELNDIEAMQMNKKNLSPVYEFENENEYNQFPNTTPTSLSNTASMEKVLTKH